MSNEPEQSLFSDQNKQKLNQILLILLGLFLIANLIVLDVVYFLKPKEEVVSPIATVIEKVREVKKIEKTKEPSLTEISEEQEADYRLICQEEISQALATISSETKEVVKTVYQQTPSVSQPSVIYIPLGGGVSTTNGSWSYVGGAEAYFDKNNYSGAKNISLEVFLRIKSANGDANARLYDATHGMVISNSELLSGTESFILRSSPALGLLEGNNLYQVQLRSTTGYEAFMDGARLKVEY